MFHKKEIIFLEKSLLKFSYFIRERYRQKFAPNWFGGKFPQLNK